MTRMNRCGRFGLVLLGVVVTAVLQAMAYASPPDPSWIEGVYDDADYDDVVLLVTCSKAIVESLDLSAPRPPAPVPGSVPELDIEWVPASSVLPSHPRAPPAS